jgi:hypothetical protein
VWRIDLKILSRKRVNFSDDWLKRADWFVGNLGACPEGVAPLNLVNISYSSLVENPQRAINSMYKNLTYHSRTNLSRLLNKS